MFLYIVGLDQLRTSCVDCEEFVCCLFRENTTAMVESVENFPRYPIPLLPLYHFLAYVLQSSLHFTDVHILAPGFLSLSGRLFVLLRRLFHCRHLENLFPCEGCKVCQINISEMR